MTAPSSRPLNRRQALAAPALVSPWALAQDKFYQPVIYRNTADYTAYAARSFGAEKATIERLKAAGKL